MFESIKKKKHITIKKLFKRKGLEIKSKWFQIWLTAVIYIILSIDTALNYILKTVQFSC